MRSSVLRRLVAVVAFVAPLTASAQGYRFQGDARDTMPFAPFRIIGNLHYVGSRGIASFLITTPQGHILIDSGHLETAPIILDNITALGFKLRDVKILLSTHAHFDHVAGHALVQRKTGARIYASAPDALLLESGGKADFRFGNDISFEPVKVDRRFSSGDTVQLGGTTLTARVTPGHTKGNTLWMMKVTEAGKTYDVVVAPSMSINPGVKLVSYAPYPEIARDYSASLDYLESLHPDVWVGPHAGFFDMEAKAQKLRSGATTNPFIDPDGYQRFVAGYRKSFLAQLKAEQGVPVP